MQVFQFRKHYGVTHDRLRVRSFLPDLVLTFRLVSRALVAQLVEESIASFGFQLFDDLSRTVPLQISKHTGKIWCSDNGVEVRIEDNPGVDFQRFMLATVFECSDEDVAPWRGREDGKPGHRCASNEMRVVALENSIAAAHDGAKRGEAQLR